MSPLSPHPHPVSILHGSFTEGICGADQTVGHDSPTHHWTLKETDSSTAITWETWEELMSQRSLLELHHWKYSLDHVWWLTHGIPALGRGRQEEQEFETSLGCMRLYLKENKTNKPHTNKQQKECDRHQTFSLLYLIWIRSGYFLPLRTGSFLSEKAGVGGLHRTGGVISQRNGWNSAGKIT